MTGEVRTGTLGDGERCSRCGGENVVWSAPSPLWNLVMRDNDINAKDRYGFACIRCFIVCADEAGLVGRWRVWLNPEPEGALYVTPSGRVWDAERWLWVEPRDLRTEVAEAMAGMPVESMDYESACAWLENADEAIKVMERRKGQG